MTTTSSCPEEHALLPIAMGETASESLGRHVDACPDCRGRLERLRAELAALPRDLGPDQTTCEDPGTADRGQEPPAPARIERRPEVPHAIGKYLIVELLDQGGQGEVYRVLHPNLGKEMVLKLGRRPFDDDERAALVDEGRVLIELEHINLVRVYDSGVHDDRPFLVMEYVLGRNLEVYAREETITPRRAAELVAKLAGALAVVHRKGIVHRDIKPRNIMIDEAGEPRLIDFGLARLRHAWSDSEDPPWGGTLAFMAPEQARFEHDRIGPRSDIFGLGAVLYFLLTGQPPFEGGKLDEIWDRARRCDFDAGRLRAGRVPRRLERICRKALAADPADRHGTAEEFGRALRGFLRRPSTVAAGAALLLVASSVAVVASAWVGQRGRPGAAPPPAAVGQEPGRMASPGTLVKVDRGGSRFGLRDALPLRNGDLLWIEFRVPRGWGASAFWFDTESHLTQLEPVRREADGPAERLSYPAAGAIQLVGPAGTESIFVCARPSGPPRLDEVADLFPAGRPWPPLADRELILLDRDRITVEVSHDASSRGGGAVRASGAREQEEMIDRLRRTLADRFDYVAGATFPHQDPEPSSTAPDVPKP
jgi:tRNA A-37 threonylcarbamoyl transferase component Bud32